MKATVGRVVHFYSAAIADKDPARPGYGLNGQGAGPYVATVIQCFDGPYVNLKVVGWGVEAWDEGSVSEKSAKDTDAPEHARYWDGHLATNSALHPPKSSAFLQVADDRKPGSLTAVGLFVTQTSEGASNNRHRIGARGS